MLDITEILLQNKWPPKKYDVAYIEGFEHWYSTENLDRIDRTLKSIYHNTAGIRCLDIGFGNPIVLERTMKIFPQCRGLYVTLEKAINKGIPKSILDEGNCYQIPFSSEEFDLISGYSLLHIVPSAREFYEEAFRTLNKGGYLYTDGDRNIYITKLLRIINMAQYRLRGNNHKYEHWRDILSPKENFHQEGIDCYELRKLLKSVGFRKVIIRPWFSVNPDYDKNIIYRALKRVVTMFNLTPFYTHVQMLAIK